MATRKELIKKYDEMAAAYAKHGLAHEAKINKSFSVDLQEMENIFDRVETWAEQRNLHKQFPSNQMLKVMEEVGELAQGLVKGNETQMVDSIGDTIVTLIVLAAQLDYRAEDCLEFAYDEIKDRKGKIVNGSFIKESDLS